jgi:hypothetical protein
MKDKRVTICIANHFIRFFYFIFTYIKKQVIYLVSLTFHIPKYLIVLIRDLQKVIYRHFLNSLNI